MPSGKAFLSVAPQMRDSKIQVNSRYMTTLYTLNGISAGTLTMNAFTKINNCSASMEAKWYQKERHNKVVVNFSLPLYPCRERNRYVPSKGHKGTINDTNL